MAQKERQMSDKALELMKGFSDKVVDSFNGDTELLKKFSVDIVNTELLKKFSVDIVNTENLPPPNMGESAHSGSSRVFGPLSPFNGFTGLGPFQSSDIPLNVLDLMRRDSQVALGMAIVKFPITQLSFTVTCENPVIKEFIKYNLQDKWASLVKDALKSLDFGFTAFEKIWEVRNLTIDPGLNARKVKNRDFIVLDKIKPLGPETITVRTDKFGNFDGINQSRTGEKIVLPRDKSMIVTNDEEFGNFFGRSRLLSAYEPWYWKQIATQFYLRYMERSSIPPYKVRYPNGMTRFSDGTEKNNADIAVNTATAISSYGNIALPAVYDDKGNLLWDIEALQPPKLNAKPESWVGFWDVQTLRGLFIPDKASLSAMDNETASQVFLSTLAPIVTELEEKINKEIITPLVNWNFTPEEREDCRINIDDIDFKKRQEMRKLLSKMLDMSSTYIKNLGGMPFSKLPDIDKILEILDIPKKDIGVFFPSVVTPDGKEIKDPEEIKELLNKKDSQTQGPEKAEKTEGNVSKKGRDGEPIDEDKKDNGE